MDFSKLKAKLVEIKDSALVTVAETSPSTLAGLSTLLLLSAIAPGAGALLSVAVAYVAVRNYITNKGKQI